MSSIDSDNMIDRPNSPQLVGKTLNRTTTTTFNKLPLESALDESPQVCLYDSDMLSIMLTKNIMAMTICCP